MGKRAIALSVGAALTVGTVPAVNMLQADAQARTVRDGAGFGVKRSVFQSAQFAVRDGDGHQELWRGAG